MLFYAVLAVIAIAGIRYILHHLRGWKHWLPLIIVGVMFCCCGIAEAGVLPVSDLPGIAVRPFWWNAISWLVIIITTLFL
jgi:uncharacterized membrane protein